MKYGYVLQQQHSAVGAGFKDARTDHFQASCM